jgi:tRNA pseudouridine38-40 synthase
MRIAAIVEYDGSGFSGWQLQDGVRTVQGEIESAIARVADESIRVTTAGRTDTGVHATAQVIHFDTSAERSNHSWLNGVNANLPEDVVLRWVSTVDDNFHARFAATGRRYHYVILNRRQRPTFQRGKVTWERRPLDEHRMQQAANDLVGEHDFSAFRTVHCQAKSPVRELRELTVWRIGNRVIISACANAFLHHMVRNLAGVLLYIGFGEQPVHWAREVLETRDRTRGGITAPADGLYLTAVEYPEHCKIPQLSPETGLW